MQERHKNKLQYFQEQSKTTKKHVLPYIEQKIKITSDLNVLEIGCGEGGNLKPFLDLGCSCTGVDLSKGKIENGKNFFQQHPLKNKLTLICQDIYKWDNNEKYDIIFLRDVIEHIPDQMFFMGVLKKFLHEKSVVFFGFPPWQNPFGGHQQVCKSPVLSKLPWFHLLPSFIYKSVLELFGESKNQINNLIDIKNTGISIERFERILKKQDYKILQKTIYLVNPNYDVKFNLKPRPQFVVLRSVPWIRNFFSTAAYYLVTVKKAK